MISLRDLRKKIVKWSFCLMEYFGVSIIATLMFPILLPLLIYNTIGNILGVWDESVNLILGSITFLFLYASLAVSYIIFSRWKKLLEKKYPRIWKKENEIIKANVINAILKEYGMEESVDGGDWDHQLKMPTDDKIKELKLKAEKINNSNQKIKLVYIFFFIIWSYIVVEIFFGWIGDILMWVGLGTFMALFFFLSLIEWKENKTRIPSQKMYERLQDLVYVYTKSQDKVRDLGCRHDGNFYTVEMYKITKQRGGLEKK